VVTGHPDEEKSRRRRPHGGGHQGAPHVEKDESEVRWLISYSDFMMQLVCLFILLYSVANIDPVKAGAVAQAWREEVGLDDPKTHSDRPGPELPLTMADLPATLRSIQVVLSRYPQGSQIRISPTADGFRLQLVYEVFREREAALTKQGEPLLDLAALILKPYEARVRVIEVTGHTSAGDTEKEDGSAFRLSLSRARAAYRHVTRADAPVRLDERRLSAAGRGPHDPVTESLGPATRSLNRRIDFVVRFEPRGPK
jgi:flagellar motor protein MotB